MKLRTLLASLCLVAVVACAPASNIDPEFDRSGQTLRIKVVFHDSLADVQRAKKAATGDQVDPGLVGWAGWNNESTYCEIHTVRPKRIDDSTTMTIGHEFLHCVYGRYHGE